MNQRVALVTGGVGELGRAICRRLGHQGCKMAALDLVIEDHDRQWQAEMSAQGFEVLLLEADVTDFNACVETVQALERRLGPVDILINCAGITRDASMRKMDKEKWDAVLRTNLDSVFNVTKQVIDGMTVRGFGRVINISSVNGQKGQFGQVNYSAAKAGMHGVTMALAQEVARKGVTVNTVSPGYMATAMVMSVPEEVRNSIVAQIPVGRLGQPDEIAAAVAFLASEDASFMTGADVSVNGGQYMQ